jgi:hypothetical protein
VDLRAPTAPLHSCVSPTTKQREPVPPTNAQPHETARDRTNACESLRTATDARRDIKTHWRKPLRSFGWCALRPVARRFKFSRPDHFISWGERSHDASYMHVHVADSRNQIGFRIEDLFVRSAATTPCPTGRLWSAGCQSTSTSVRVTPLLDRSKRTCGAMRSTT